MRRIHRRFVSWRIGGFGDLGEAKGGRACEPGAIWGCIERFPEQHEIKFDLKSEPCTLTKEDPQRPESIRVKQVMSGETRIGTRQGIGKGKGIEGETWTDGTKRTI